MIDRSALHSARVMATLLAQGQRIDLWSLGLALVTVLSLLSLPLPAEGWESGASLWTPVLLGASLLAALAQRAMAMHVSFDAAIFRAWADDWAKDGAAPPTADLAAFDAALIQCGLSPPSAPTDRPLDSRLGGAHRLLKRQLAAFGVQLICLAIALLAIGLPSY